MPSKKKTATTEPTAQIIPLNRLKKSPRNVRKVPHTKEDIEALAASTTAHGVLQNPVVEPEVDAKGKPTGYFLVTIGEGRRLALLLRAKRKQIKADYPVRCIVDAEHDPLEISLAENAIRSGMHPADQFDAFHQLHTARGMSAEDIAARFGVTPPVVRQRLKLAAVSPKLIAIYRAGEMTLDQLTGFAVTDDIAWQEQVWEDAGRYARREDIVAALTQAQVPARDPRAVFVGSEAYRAAGGAITQDLFAEGDGGYFEDADLLLRLASQKLEALAADIRAEGWKWVEVMPRMEHSAVAEFRRVYPVPRELSKKDQRKLNKLEAEYQALEYDETDESSANDIARLEEAIAAIQGEPVFEPEAIARAGAIVTIRHDGRAEIVRGYVRPEDDERPSKSAVAEKENGSAALSEKLLTELTAYKTMALQDALGTDTDVALTAITHNLALAACYHFAGEHSCLEVAGRSRNVTSLAPAIGDYAPTQRVAARHEAIRSALPQNPEALWDHLAALKPEERLALLAHCLAFTVDAVHRPMPNERRSAHVDQLARAVGLDMAKDWSPTVANYLGRVSKERILEAVREGVSHEAAQNLAPLKKGAMADAAEQRLARRGWVPAPLRNPSVEAGPNAQQPSGRRSRAPAP